MEWIIIDDRTDKIDIGKDVPCVKYYHYTKKMSLKEANLMHEKTSGEIWCMDDDDYYPPC